MTSQCPDESEGSSEERDHGRQHCRHKGGRLARRDDAGGTGEIGVEIGPDRNGHSLATLARQRALVHHKCHFLA